MKIENKILPIIFSLVAIFISCNSESIEDDSTNEVVGVAYIDDMSRAVNNVSSTN